MKWGYVWAVVDCYVFMLDNVGILCYSQVQQDVLVGVELTIPNRIRYFGSAVESGPQNDQLINKHILIIITGREY